jgi:hypothetical protein
VDNARRMIGKNADIAVTSVLQTTAGKMIFGRLWEDTENGAPGEQRVAHVGNSRRPFQREQRANSPAPVRQAEHSEPIEQ